MTAKEQLLTSFKGKTASEGKKRIIIETTALRMGMNFPDIEYVINWGPARNLLDYHQEPGKAGRDYRQAHSTVLYHRAPGCSL